MKPNAISDSELDNNLNSSNLWKCLLNFWGHYGVKVHILFN